MKGVLLEFKKYENLDDFLKSLFYKNENLAEYAFKFLSKLEGEKVLFTKKWKRHIIDIFECYPPKKHEREKLKKILNSHSFDIDKGRGKKAYFKILKKNESNEIDLDSKDKMMLKKNVDWNSAISSYYSILKKLEKVGIIEKNNGEIRKSNKFSKKIINLRKMFSEEKDDSFVYSPK